MENRSKFVLLACILLLVAALVFVGSYIENYVVGYPVGFALFLLGAIFWVSAE
jgi:hypothetical protein